MMHKDYPIVHCARVTIEARTPISIKADDADPTLDTRLMRDAHGLPTLPGTSLAGVMRHLHRLLTGDPARTDTLFGTAATHDTDSTGTHIARARFSFGHVHSANNQPVRGSIGSVRTEDEILTWLQDTAPVLRDQVKLNAYGAAEDKAKHDRSALPRGTRFTFELMLLDKTADPTSLNELLSLMTHPLFRIGGLTHRGFGAVTPVAASIATFDLSTEQGLTDWQTWRATPWHEAMDPFPELTPPSPVSHFHIPLEAEDFWRIGQGDTPLGDDYDKAPDLLPYHEKTIGWQDGRAHIRTRQVVVPASSLKGALRHRTVYHYLRLSGGHDHAAWQQVQQATQPLFGLEMDHANATGGTGYLILDDIYLEDTPQVSTQPHIAIDRFTGGVMRGALFSEELLWKGGFSITGWIAPPRKPLERTLIDAFRLALEDLAQGRINLGADFARGHGFFHAPDFQHTQLDAPFQALEDRT